MKPDKLDEMFLQHLTPSRRIDLICERLDDLTLMLEEVGYEIRVSGVEPED